MGAAVPPVSRNGTSGPVQALLLLESVGLAVLGFWLGKEYENNVYLREYVHNVAWSYLPLLAFVATFSVALGVSEAYARTRGRRSVEPLVVGGSQPETPLLAGGLGIEPSGSGQDSSAGPGVEGSESAGLGVSFAEAFTDSRPPAVLRHVEPSESIELYSPPPFPVVRRLKPVRDPVEEEQAGPDPRPLNRVGMGPGFSLLPPPVVRQIGRSVAAGDAVEDSGSVEESSGEEESLPRREARSRLRPVKKSEVSSDLTNDLSGGESAG